MERKHVALRWWQRGKRSLDREDLPRTSEDRGPHELVGRTGACLPGRRGGGRFFDGVLSAPSHTFGAGGRLKGLTQAKHAVERHSPCRRRHSVPCRRLTARRDVNARRLKKVGRRDGQKN
jgi:hypothetical protein